MPDHARLPLWNDQSLDERIETLHRLIVDLYGYVLQDALEWIGRLLAAHQPYDAKERADIATIQSMVRRYPNILSPNCEAGHITGSALVLDATTGAVLLHYHKSLGRWLQLGGHPENETDPARIALREATEESGLPDLRFFPDESEPRPLDIDVHIIPAAGGKPEHLHLDFRYLLVTQQPSSVQKNSADVGGYLWVSLSEIQDEAGSLGGPPAEDTPRLIPKLDPQLIRLIEKANRIYNQVPPLPATH